MRRSSNSNLLPWIRRLARGFRDICFIGALSLALILGIEIAYRGYERLFPARLGDPAVPAGHPYAGESWFRAWAEARLHHTCCADTAFDPYRGWWVQPGRHEGLNVEASGYRHTVQPPGTGPESTRRVFLFGGSAMWGYTARDAATIPSHVAAQLAAAGITNFNVENKAQSAFNLTQGLATLILELRRGERPAAVVFLDGVNEIGVIAEGGQPGEIYGEANARERYQRAGGNAKGLLLELGVRLHVIVALRAAITRREPPAVDVPAACGTIADSYANLVRIGEALAGEFGFKIFFLWQPTLATSRKASRPWEAQLRAERASVGPMMVELMKACTPEVEARFAQRRGSTFHSLRELFDGTRDDVFLDHFGHVTEQANAAIAEVMTERLLPVLR